MIEVTPHQVITLQWLRGLVWGLGGHRLCRGRNRSTAPDGCYESSPSWAAAFFCQGQDSGGRYGRDISHLLPFGKIKKSCFRKKKGLLESSGGVVYFDYNNAKAPPVGVGTSLLKNRAVCSSTARANEVGDVISSGKTPFQLHTHIFPFIKCALDGLTSLETLLACTGCLKR